MNRSKIPETFYIYEMNYHDFQSHVHHRTRRKKYKVVDQKSFAPYYLLMRKTTTIRWTMIILVFVAAITIGIMSIIPLLGGAGMDRRSGIVTGSQIKYVQDDVKYIDLDDAGIDPSEVQDGDKVTMYFEDDKLVSAEPDAVASMSNIKGIICMFAALLGCPIIIVSLIMWTGRFSINAFATGIYGYRKEGNTIMLKPLCVPCRRDGSIKEYGMEQKVLLQVRKRKRYGMGITRAEAVIYTPSTGTEQKTRLWVLNDEAYYDEIMGLEQ